MLECGGLFVLGTERHESRRIDNQLRGRSGRQGDVGASRFFLSLQDPLMRRFYKDWVTNAMERLGMKEGVPIESPMVTRAIERAQKKVEDYHFEIRKSLLEYDEVMDEQRKTIYGVRQEVLESKGLKEKVLEMLGSVVPRMAAAFAGDAEGYRGWFHRTFGFELDEAAATSATGGEDGDCEAVIDAVLQRYEEREREIGEELMRRVDRHLLLHAIDTKWMDHLRAITALRQGIGLRGYAQKDPKNEYKAEGFELFQKLLAAIEDEVTSLILRVEVRRPDETEPRPAAFTRPPDTFGRAQAAPSPEAVRAAQALALARARQVRRPPASAAFDQMRRTQTIAAARAASEARAEARRDERAAAPRRDATAPSVDFVGAGRNDPCPCGSGKKFKKCHGQ